MKIRTMAWFAGSAFVVAMGGVGAAACSSDNGGGTGNPGLPTGDSSVPPMDGAKAPGMDTGVTPGMDSGTPDMDTGTGMDTGTPCAKPPGIGHAPLGNGQYFCPFTAKQADGGYPTCKIGTETCCITIPDGGPNTPSTCGATCPAGEITWQCDQTGDCAMGSICCLTAATLEADPKCMGFQKAKQFKGTACVVGTACPAAPAGQSVYQACEADSDCGGGKKCTAIHASGAQIGVCL